jgi:hypothetical protein
VALILLAVSIAKKQKQLKQVNQRDLLRWFFMAGFFKGVADWLIGGGLNSAVDHIKERVQETIAEMEERIERATVKVMKTLALFFMIAIGLIFMLVGLSQFLNETVPRLAHGLGTVLVGAVLVLLALFAKMMR